MAAIQGDWYASRSTHDGEAYPQSDNTVRFVYATQADGTKFIVAKVWSGDDGDYASTARLIAACPELLAAAQGMQSAFYYGDGNAQVIAIGLLRKAIAKAEGRTDEE